MRRFVEFLKTTAIGGLLVIVPIAIVLFVLAQLLFGLYSFAAAVIAQLNIQVSDAAIILAIALAALIGLCFVTGLLVQTRLGRYLKHWFGRKVGRRIPMFSAIASLTKRFAGVEGQDFAPVELDLFGSDARLLGFLVERLPGRRCVVFVPSAPVATVGNVYVVDEGAITAIDASVADTFSAITQWGVETRKLYGTTDLGADDNADSG